MVKYHPFVLAIGFILPIILTAQATTLAQLKNSSCPKEVLKACEIVYRGHENSVIEKCKKGMHPLWNQSSMTSKKLLFLAAETEEVLDNTSDSTRVVVRSKISNVSRANCAGANTFGLACGAASIIAGLFSFGIGSVLSAGCFAASAVTVGVCGV